MGNTEVHTATLANLRERKERLRVELAVLADIGAELTEGQVRDLNDKLRAWDKLEAEEDRLRVNEDRALIEQAERRGRLRAAHDAAQRGSSTYSIEGGDGTRRAPVPGVTDRNPFDTTELRAMIHLRGGDMRDVGRELSSRAVQAIEESTAALEDEHRQCAVVHVERDPSIALHVLRTGSPEYLEAFNDYLGGDLSAAARFPEESRAAMSLTGANGGFMVPFTLDPTIMLTNNGATNPMRAISTVKTITTDDWNGVTSAGVTAEWLAEATEAADASPTVAQPSITAHKAAAWIQASIEVTQDAGIASEIGKLIVDAKDRLEATAFVVGTGSGQPKGVVTSVSGVTASRVAGTSQGGGGTYVVGDVYALSSALPPRFRPNSSWLAEQTTLNATRQFATGAGPQHAFWADLGVAIPPLLLGRPVYESSEMDSTIVSGSTDDVLLLGDFRAGYFIVDRVGLAIAYEPLVKGSNRRPTGEVGWFSYWRVGGDSPGMQNAFRLLRL